MLADTLLHFIAGRSVAPGSDEYLDKHDPMTGDLMARVANGCAGDVDLAVGSASAAFKGWADQRPIERGRVLSRLAAALRADSAAFAAIERREAGKAAWQGPSDVEVAARYFEFYGGMVNALQGEAIDLGSGYHSYTRREPYGVVGVILPWNAALNQAARAIAPALAAGNVVVAKPSEEACGSLVRLAALAVECGLPAGVLNIVLGGAVTGGALVEHPLVRKVAFTGSVRAGREIGRVAANRILPLTLELGGKSPNIVFEDADFDAAVAGAIRAFVVNAGQICLAGTRLLVQNTIFDRFVTALAAGVAAVKVGPGDDDFVGAITTRAQYEKVLAYFTLAREEGARALTGGAPFVDPVRAAGFFVPPTVYVDVSPGMRIAREEIFGPVLVVMPFNDENEAIAIANDTDFGLAAGLWTRDLARTHRVAAALEAGQIYVNEYQAGGVETPLGGYKQSGYGREKGLEALHHYTHLKCVTIKL